MTKSSKPKAGEGTGDEGAPTNDALKKGDVALINTGSRVYRTSAGDLRPGHSVAVPAKEAEALLDYHDIKDASKVAPSIGKTIDELREQLDNALAEVKAKDEKIAALEEDLTKAKAEIDDLLKK